MKLSNIKDVDSLEKILIIKGGKMTFSLQKKISKSIIEVPNDIKVFK